MQKVYFRTEFPPSAFKELWDMAEITLAGPKVLRRHVLLGGLVVRVAGPYAIGAREARNARLCADGFVANLQIMANGACHLFVIGAACMTLFENRITRSAAKKLVKRNVGVLGLNAPKHRVDRGNSAHRDRAATPIGPLVEVLPSVFISASVSTNQ
jgi:hypothetical protein